MNITKSKKFDQYDDQFQPFDLGTPQKAITSNIYVGNLAFEVTEEGLRKAFEVYGEVVSASIIVDKMSGHSRGFVFVEMKNDAEKNEAVNLWKYTKTPVVLDTRGIENYSKKTTLVSINELEEKIEGQLQPQPAPEVKRNLDKYATVQVLELEEKALLCRVEWAGRTFRYRFPNSIKENLKLEKGDRFVWYPQKRDVILPEDCMKNPPPITAEEKREIFAKLARLQEEE